MGAFSKSPEGPSEPCQAVCCQRGAEWARYHYTLDLYQDGPSEQELNSIGCWQQLTTEVKLWSQSLQSIGLVEWQALSPESRGLLESWSPVAQQLWESDFVAHREGIIQACVWHYLDDNLFSFAPNLEERALVEPSSPAWEHVRGLRRQLNALSTCKGAYDDPIYRIQFSAWNRLTEHLVRRGLGLPRPVAPAHLVAHFKRFLRPFVVDGEGQLPDDAHDGELDNIHVGHQDIGSKTETIRQLLRDALNAQVYLHGMRGSYTLRFAPIGSDKTSDFPFDEDWMQAANAEEVPPTRRDQPHEPLPPVQLVTQPMLVASGLDGLNFDRKFSLVTPMRVITPWTFGGPEAKEFIFPGFEKGWQFRSAEVLHGRFNRWHRELRERERSTLADQAGNTAEPPSPAAQMAESRAAPDASDGTTKEES